MPDITKEEEGIIKRVRLVKENGFGQVIVIVKDKEIFEVRTEQVDRKEKLL